MQHAKKMEALYDLSMWSSNITFQPFIDEFLHQLTAGLTGLKTRVFSVWLPKAIHVSGKARGEITPSLSLLSGPHPSLIV